MKKFPAITSAILIALSPTLALANTVTPVLGLNEPTVGADTNTWGTLLNANSLTLDGLFVAGPYLNLANGGTGSGTASGARTALGVPTGTSGAVLGFLNGTNTYSGVQTFTLAPVFTDQSGSRTALGLGTAATQNIGTAGAVVPLLNSNNAFSGTTTFTLAPVFTDQSGSRTALGLGTSAVAATGTSGHTVPFLDGVNTWSTTQTFTAAPVFSNQSGTQTALGLGTAAIQNTGTSGANLPFLNGTNTWAAAQTFTTAPVFSNQSGSRTALGLGTIAVEASGTSGHTVPFLDGTNTWSASQTFSATTNINASANIGNSNSNTATITGHVVSSGSVPSLTSGSGCGTSPTISGTATDFRGSFQAGTGVPGGACQLTFSRTFASTPVCMIQGTSNVYMDIGSSAASFVIFKVLTDGQTYQYTCIG